MELNEPTIYRNLAAEFLKRDVKDHVYVKTPTPPRIKTSTTAKDVRSYIENFTLYRKISNPEWNLLKGKFSNRTIKKMTKQKLIQAINRSAFLKFRKKFLLKKIKEQSIEQKNIKWDEIIARS